MPANPSSRTSSLASSADSAPSAANTNNAALLGAATAFGRQPPQPRTQPKTIAGTSSSSSNNGAVSVATSAGHTRRSEHSPARSFSRSPPPATGLHGVNEKPSGKASRMAKVGDVRPVSHLHSQQAAVLAAARAKPSASAAPMQQTMRTGQRPVVGPRPSHRPHETTDSTSIAPTTSLVDLFEQRAKTVATPAKRPEPVIVKPSTDLPLRSPKPVRSGGMTSMIQSELEGRNGKQPTSTETTTRQKVAVVDQSDRPPQSSDDSYASASEDVNDQTPPPKLANTAPRTLSPSPGDRLRAQNEAKRRPQPSASPSRTDHAQSQAFPLSQYPPSRPISAQSTGRSISSMRSYMSIPAQFNAAHPRKMTPLRTGDELANALVASSLASSRAPSPSRLEPPPVLTRRRKDAHHKFSFSRTPSPTKAGMLQTLRKPADTSSSESEDEKHPYRKHHKKRLVRKHPNKHHEGDRKRWRDAVTERERKRYEGVWAANKGLHYSFSAEEQEFFEQHPQHQRTKDTKAGVTDSVSSIVTREIWNRSRLPATVLEFVWDLVDGDRVARLGKEEFVVGMWLIDQRLKGRKLPIRVSESVWASVRGIGGIKVKVRR
ncbi:Putative EH domain, EF-hand domain pair protein [Septoria linicola]|uniref:EH domain, EF-hand domain pair protein n=1 Tax=Septoria linicola TaxID=215465 RepID=A0A9Q9AH77_9PEZI|nr:Putative EH domain, EF-hand domain pair protein [Septoria linicola]